MLNPSILLPYEEAGQPDELLPGFTTLAFVRTDSKVRLSSFTLLSNVISQYTK